MSRKPADWAEFHTLLRSTEIPDGFLSADERAQAVSSLPWDSEVAACYGLTRAALSAAAVLVTNDQAFRQIDGLLLEDWTIQ